MSIDSFAMRPPYPERSTPSRAKPDYTWLVFVLTSTDPRPSARAIHRRLSAIPPASPPRHRVGPQRLQFAFEVRRARVRNQGLGYQTVAARTLLGGPFFGLRQQGSKVGDTSFKRRYRSGVGRLHVPPFVRRRFILLRIHVEQNAGLAIIARPWARPGRALPNGFRVRSERRSSLSRSGPHCLAIGQLIFGHWCIPATGIERPFG
jgi:hypothetical protein